MLATHDMDGFEVSALNTLQHGLSVDTEHFHRFAHRHKALARIAIEASHDVFRQSDAPWRPFGPSAAGQE